jgi:hypothetical protein
VIARWFSQGTPVSSTNEIDCHDIAEILLKVTLNTITEHTIAGYTIAGFRTDIKLSEIFVHKNNREKKKKS